MPNHRVGASTVSSPAGIKGSHGRIIEVGSITLLFVAIILSLQHRERKPCAFFDT